MLVRNSFETICFGSIPKPWCYEEVNIIHYNAAIAVCDRANLWSYALHFLQRIEEMQLNLSFNLVAVAQACSLKSDSI